MRCTKEVKEKILKDFREAEKPFLQELNEKVDKEEKRVKEWTKNQYIELENLIKPVVYAWAKNLKKNYSSYIWKNGKTSGDLTDCILKCLFHHTYGSWLPGASSKTLESLYKKRNDADKQKDALLIDAYIKVAECKNLSELYEMINSYKEKIKDLYANSGSSKKSG